MSTTTKISIAIIGAFLAVVIAGALGVVIGRASASPSVSPLANILNPQPPQPPQPGAAQGIRGFGRITAVGTDSVTVETHNGRTVTLQVDENTNYARMDSHDIALADLKAGDTVVGRVERRNGQGAYAPHVFVVPEEALAALLPGSPDRLNNAPGFGVITAVGADSITLETGSGEARTLQVDGNTRVTRVSMEEIELTGLQAGDNIIGPFRQQEGGALFAERIIVIPDDLPLFFAPAGPKPPQGGMPGFGTITAIGPDSITVETRDGRTITVQVDENTKVNRVTVEETDLAGLQVGDTVAGPVQPREDGTFYAPNVTVVPEQFPEALGRFFQGAADQRLAEQLAPMLERMHRQWHERMEGEAQEMLRRTVTITAIDGNVLTVALRDGSTRQITVADDAVIRLGRDPQCRGAINCAPTLADLRVGQIIITDAPLEAENPIAHHIIIRPEPETP